MSDDIDQIEPPSKSARKREAERLQQIGRRLGELRTEHLETLDLPDNLLAAIIDYQRFPSREAKRRQLQYVGKLMRETDTDAIEAHLADLDGESAQARYQFNQLEQWRDELVNDPQALTRFISDYPHVDRQHLRQLIKKVSSAKHEEQRKIHARALFRFLRQTVTA